MAVTWTPEVWQLAYRAEIGDPSQPDFGQMVTYGRRFFSAFNRNFVASAIARFDTRSGNIIGAITNTSGLVLGCAYGYLIESMTNAGLTDVWGADISQYIFDNMVMEQPSATIRNRIKQWDIRTAQTASPNGRQFWSGFIGGNGRFSWIITEEMLSSYTDAEIPAILDNCEYMLSGNNPSKIIHIVDINSPAPFNTKTPAQWKAFRATHTWVNASTGQVI